MIRQTPYKGSILRVDLTSGKIHREQFDPQSLRMFVGGNGLGAKILYDEVPPGVSPYDPENRLILASGPLGGTMVPGSGTISVVTKGPMTNLLGAAQANGFFGARLRLAGFDVIVIQGAPPKWQYLCIHDGEAELRPADHLLGLDTWDTESRVKKELARPKASVACIGVPGENLIPFTGICCDYGHIASTNGPGAVMGSKKLKAIAVFSSGQQRSVPVFDAEQVKHLARGPLLEAAEKNSLGKMVKHMGTHGYHNALYPIGAVPTKNLTTNIFPEAEKFTGQSMRSNFERKPKSCWRCPWGHTAMLKVTKGPLAGYEGEEPEYEALAAFSSLVGIGDPATAIKLANLNDRHGMDVKECGYAIAMAIECYEKGVIGPGDTDGLELRWGNAEAIEQLIEAIAHRRGFGNVLADGVKRAAERIGGDALEFAVYNGQGIAPHILDGRGHWPILSGLAFSDNGSWQAQTQHDPDVGNVNPIPSTSDHKVIASAMARAVGKTQFRDVLGMCAFFIGPLDPIIDTLNAATGWNLTKEECLQTGHRIAAIMRAFNLRHGKDPHQSDRPSPRYGSAPVDGMAQGISIAPVIAEMATIYYREMGWDEPTSKPLPETLSRLGLEKVSRDLWG